MNSGNDIRKTRKCKNQNMGQKHSRKLTVESIDFHITSKNKDINPTLDYAFLQDQKTISYLKGSRIMIILRGLPGSGKSFLANKIFNKYKNCCVVCCMDDYFIHRDGTYQFERTLLRDAHEYCQKNAFDACRNGISVVVIDNANVRLWEMEFYFNLAQKMDYFVIIAEPKTKWKFNVMELMNHSKNNVTRSLLETRLEQWENIKPLFYGWFLNCSDSKNVIDIAQTYFESCFEIPEFYSEMQMICGTSNKKEIITYYSRNSMIENGSILHCTAKFCGDRMQDLHSYSNNENVENSVGKVFATNIIGFFVTKNTFGARVKLTKNQLKLWSMDDNENTRSAKDASSDFIVSGMRNMSLNAKPRPMQNSHQLQNNSLLNINKPTCSCIPTLKIINNKYLGSTYSSQNKGRRAHLTLGCTPGVKPKQTGLDLIDIVKEEMNLARNSISVPTYNISTGKLKHYSYGLWVIYPNKQAIVDTIFTFHS